MHAMPKVMSCGVLIVRGNPIQQFLLMEHADRLDLPKGHVDPGESEFECAIRELEEETGIRVTDIEVDEGFRFEHRYRVTPKKKKLKGKRCEKTLVIFLGRLVNDVEIVPTEHLGYAWHDWNPPHQIQAQTIDPLLAQLSDYLDNQ